MISARLGRGKPLQRGRVQEALIRSDDYNARNITVMQHEARWRCVVREAERQENTKRFAWSDLIRKESRRSSFRGQRRGAGLVAPSLPVFQLGSRIARPLADPLGDARNLYRRNPIATGLTGLTGYADGAVRDLCVNRGCAPIVEAPAFTGGVEASWKCECEADESRRVDRKKDAHEPDQTAGRLPPAPHGG